MSKFITKRDCSIVTFDINKIQNALQKAFDNTNVNNPNMNDILSYINEELQKKEKDNYNIEDIQDLK